MNLLDTSLVAISLLIALAQVFHVTRSSLKVGGGDPSGSACGKCLARIQRSTQKSK